MKKRKITSSLYLFLAALFIFGATFLAIIISQGGSVSDDGVFTNSGVLRVNVAPENSTFTLFVDDKPIDNLVNKGTNLEAGIHTIRIESPGMLNWEKKVNIRQGIVTDILAKLFPLDLKLEQITSSNISKAIFSPYGDYLFYIVSDTQIPSELGIWRLQIGQNGLFFFNTPSVPIKFAEFDASISELLLDPGLILKPSPDHNRMLAISPLNQKIYLFNSLNGTEPQKVVDILAEIGFFPKNVDWLNDSISLLIDDDKTLYELDLTNQRTTLIKYDPQQSIIYGYNQSHLIWFDRVKKTLNIYKNQLNTKLDLMPIDLSLYNIQDVELPKNSSRYLTIKTESNYLLIDIEENKIYNFDLPVANYSLLEISPDSTTYLFKDNQQKLHTIVAKENLGLDQMEIKSYDINISVSESDKVKFSPSGSNIFMFNNQDRTIVSFEQDGANLTTLIQNELINPTFGLDSQLRSLYLLLQDGNNQITDSQTPLPLTTNLYSIGLEVGN
jgi:hypothetical protein